MSIQDRVDIDALLSRVDILEQRLDMLVDVIQEPVIEEDAPIHGKHLGFGKWGIADEAGNVIDKGPYKKEEVAQIIAAG
jgi:hypothetical protein